MLIKDSIKIDENLEKILEELRNIPENILNVKDLPGNVFIIGDGTDEVTLYSNDKYAEFGGEFDSPVNPAFKKLYDYLNNNGWKSNLD